MQRIISIILDDDIVVVHKEAMFKYIEQMTKLNIGFMFFGFNNANMLTKFSQKPNPTVDVKITDDYHVILNRNACTGAMFFNMHMIGDIRFDDRLDVLFLDEFISRCAEAKIIPHDGLYFDVWQSWKLFKRQENIKTLKKIDPEKYKSDAKILDNDKKKINRNIVIDPYLDFLCEKIYNIKTKEEKDVRTV